jgi:hypothetical protein
MFRMRLENEIPNFHSFQLQLQVFLGIDSFEYSQKLAVNYKPCSNGYNNFAF